MYKKMKLMYPKGFLEFKCIGGKCEDTCCKGWDIEVDKGTFDQYCKVKDKKMIDKLYEGVFINEDCTSYDLDYGIIKLDKNKRCFFLDENNYCLLYSKLGEEYLTNVCTHFPRTLNKIDNEYEISLDVSCPEAARIVMSNEEKIKFETSVKKFNKYIISTECNPQSKKFKNSPIKYFKQIREFSIKIMQNRNFNLSERFFILGDFIYKLEEKIKKNLDLVPEFINNYNINEAVSFYKKDKKNYIFQIIFFKNIIETSDIVKKTLSESLKNYTRELLKGFKVDSIDDYKKNIDKYIDKFDEYDEKFIQKYSYIFENYLVNFMYGNLFPFSESDSMIEGYVMLLVRYSFIRFYLIGRYINNGGDSKDDIIRFIQSFAKGVEHDREYLYKVLETIKESRYDNFNSIKKFF